MRILRGNFGNSTEPRQIFVNQAKLATVANSLPMKSIGSGPMLLSIIQL